MIRAMPILKSAIKKLRQDKKKTVVNDRYRSWLKKALKEAAEKLTKKTISEAYTAIDRAAKRKIIHPNKASRLKSNLIKAAKRKVKKS